LVQIKKGDGDATIARYGENLLFRPDENRFSINTTVMLNHLALARQFSISDNFYVDADVSADGARG
jgi:hypothetical protein